MVIEVVGMISTIKHSSSFTKSTGCVTDVTDMYYACINDSLKILTSFAPFAMAGNDFHKCMTLKKFLLMSKLDFLLSPIKSI